jgi:hypothetical protein
MKLLNCLGNFIRILLFVFWLQYLKTNTNYKIGALLLKSQIRELMNRIKMQKVFNKRILGIFILALFSFSCTSNLDFNQVNTLKLTPVYVANFATFEVPANEFVTNGVEQTVSGEVSDFDVFRDTYFKKSLTRADLFFEFNNTINRAYKINLYFLDINNNPVYSISFPVITPYTGTTNLVTKTEIFENAKLDLLKTTKRIAFTVTMASGVPLTENSLGSLKLRSSATVYLTLQ